MLEITKEEFEERYKTTEVAQLSRELGITQGTLYNLLKKAGIPLKGCKGRARPQKVKIV